MEGKVHGAQRTVVCSHNWMPCMRGIKQVVCPCAQDHSAHLCDKWRHGLQPLPLTRRHHCVGQRAIVLAGDDHAREQVAHDAVEQPRVLRGWGEGTRMKLRNTVL